MHVVGHQGATGSTTGFHGHGNVHITDLVTGELHRIREIAATSCDGHDHPCSAGARVLLELRLDVNCRGVVGRRANRLRCSGLHALDLFSALHPLGQLIKLCLQGVEFCQLLSSQLPAFLFSSRQGLDFLVYFRSLAAEFFDRIHIAFLFLSGIKKAAKWPPG